MRLLAVVTAEEEPETALMWGYLAQAHGIDSSICERLRCRLGPEQQQNALRRVAEWSEARDQSRAGAGVGEGVGLGVSAPAAPGVFAG